MQMSKLCLILVLTKAETDRTLPVVSQFGAFPDKLKPKPHQEKIGRKGINILSSHETKQNLPIVEKTLPI